MADPSAYLPILRMSTSLTATSKVVDPSTGSEPAPPVKPMEKEEAEWLRAALESHVIDPNAEMRAYLKTVQEEEKDEDKLLEALEALTFYAENIDQARDMAKNFRGLTILIQALERPSSTPRSRAEAANALGTMLQNNPDVQLLANGSNLLEVVVKQMLLRKREDRATSDVVKALFVVSSLIRQNDAALTAWIKDYFGFRILCEDILKAELTDAKFVSAKRKAVSLMLYMLERVPAAVETSAAHVLPAVLSALQTDVEDIDLKGLSVRLLGVFGDQKNGAKAKLAPALVKEVQDALARLDRTWDVAADPEGKQEVRRVAGLWK